MSDACWLCCWGRLLSWCMGTACGSSAGQVIAVHLPQALTSPTDGCLCRCAAAPQRCPPGKFMSQGLVRLCPQGFFRENYVDFDAGVGSLCEYRDVCVRLAWALSGVLLAPLAVRGPVQHTTPPDSSLLPPATSSQACLATRVSPLTAPVPACSPCATRSCPDTESAWRPTSPTRRPRCLLCPRTSPPACPTRPCATSVSTALEAAASTGALGLHDCACQRLCLSLWAASLCHCGPSAPATPPPLLTHACLPPAAACTSAATALAAQ